MIEDAKPKPSYAPVYAAAVYPELVPIFREHGYALAVHGSLRRDFDLVAVPWVNHPSEPENVLESITSTFAIEVVGGATNKPRGRKAWSIAIGHGHCQIDLSFLTGVDDIFVSRWPSPKLKARELYRVLCDDKGRNEGSWLQVLVDDQGDAWVSMQDWERIPEGRPSPNPSIRIRTGAGGGRNRRTRQALVWLAEAIRLDNEENGA